MYYKIFPEGGVYGDARGLAGNKNQQILLQNLSSFPEKSSNVPVKIISDFRAKIV